VFEPEAPREVEGEQSGLCTGYQPQGVVAEPRAKVEVEVFEAEATQGVAKGDGWAAGESEALQVAEAAEQRDAVVCDVRTASQRERSQADDSR
jgi:hypothetical protein